MSGKENSQKAKEKQTPEKLEDPLGAEESKDAPAEEKPALIGETSVESKDDKVQTKEKNTIDPEAEKVHSKDPESPATPEDDTKDGDKLFEPTVEMMVDDYDDEQTLAEEEALAAGEDPQEEIDDLQKEGEMSIEELMALYGCGPPPKSSEAETSTPSASTSTSTSRKRKINQNTAKAEPPVKTPPPDDAATESNVDSEESDVEQESELKKLIKTEDNDIESNDEQDIDYLPEKDDAKKRIAVGGNYQAVIPKGLCSYDDALPYENEDKLLWNPDKLENCDIEEYLQKCATLIKSSPSTSGITRTTTGSHLRDDEQALFLLQQCGYNSEEALRRFKISNATPSDSDGTLMSLWSEEECRNFESGLRLHGKSFRAIQASKVKTRSVSELVQFYYLWKKTERFDVFANKARLDKKKYSLSPCVTDYMDRFLEEHENNCAGTVEQRPIVIARFEDQDFDSEKVFYYS